MPNQTPSDLSVRTGVGGYNPPPPAQGTWFDRGWFLFLAALIVLVLLVFAVGQKFTSEIQIGGVTLHVSLGQPYGRIVQFLADGVLVTLKLTLISFVCILVVGMIGGLGRVSGNRIIGGIASLYVEIGAASRSWSGCCGSGSPCRSCSKGLAKASPKVRHRSANG